MKLLLFLVAVGVCASQYFSSQDPPQNQAYPSVQQRPAYPSYPWYPHHHSSSSSQSHSRSRSSSHHSSSSSSESREQEKDCHKCKKIGKYDGPSIKRYVDPEISYTTDKGCFQAIVQCPNNGSVFLMMGITRRAPNNRKYPPLETGVLSGAINAKQVLTCGKDQKWKGTDVYTTTTMAVKYVTCYYNRTINSLDEIEIETTSFDVATQYMFGPPVGPVTPIESPTEQQSVNLTDSPNATIPDGFGTTILSGSTISNQLGTSSPSNTDSSTSARPAGTISSATVPSEQLNVTPFTSDGSVLGSTAPTQPDGMTVNSSISSSITTLFNNTDSASTGSPSNIINKTSTTPFDSLLSNLASATVSVIDFTSASTDANTGFISIKTTPTPGNFVSAGTTTVASKTNTTATTKSGPASLTATQKSANGNSKKGNTLYKYNPNIDFD